MRAGLPPADSTGTPLHLALAQDDTPGAGVGAISTHCNLCETAGFAMDVAIVRYPRPTRGRGCQAAYIAEVRVSDAIAAKLAAKHPPVTVTEVREALVFTRLVRAWWHEHPERGRRLLVIGTTYGGRRLQAVLYPLDEEDGTWFLGTAMYVGP